MTYRVINKILIKDEYLDNYNCATLDDFNAEVVGMEPEIEFMANLDTLNIEGWAENAERIKQIRLENTIRDYDSLTQTVTVTRDWDSFEQLNLWRFTVNTYYGLNNPIEHFTVTNIFEGEI